MFNNILQRSTLSKQSHPAKYTNHLSHLFTSNRKDTLHKSNLTTMHTNNNTLSLYSNQSRYYVQHGSRKKNEESWMKRKQTFDKSGKERRKSCEKSVSKAKTVKNKKKAEKTKAAAKKSVVKSPEKIVTNKELYQGLRQSLNSQNTIQILSKISQIFDLVLANAKIPYQVQSFLFQPLQVLKTRLKQRGKSEIGKTLTQFKNNCMEVVKSSCSSQIALFHQLQLPQNMRWSSKNNHQTIKKQNQLQKRLNSFQRLKKKEAPQSIQREDERLDRIQSRLDEFLCKSVKYRKVYL